VAAAITRSAVFTRNAPFSATTESMMLNRTPFRIPAGVRTILRDWTRAECR
jgi:hypothetical protein